MQNILGPAVASAFQTARISAEMDNMREQNNVLQAQARKTNAEAMTELNRPENVGADTALKRKQFAVGETQEQLNTTTAANTAQQTKNLFNQNTQIIAEIERIEAQTTNEHRREKLIQAQTALTVAQALHESGKITMTQWETRIKQITEEILRTVAIPKARVEAAATENYTGQFGAQLRHITGVESVLQILKGIRE